MGEKKKTQRFPLKLTNPVVRNSNENDLEDMSDKEFKRMIITMLK